MHKMMIAGLAGALLTASAAMASEPVTLTDGQMDDVTAGLRFAGSLGFTGGTSVTTFGVGSSAGESFEGTTSFAVDESVFALGNNGSIGFQSTLSTGNLSAAEAGYTSGLFGAGIAATGGTFSGSLQFAD